MRCRTCNYDLTGIDSCTCPECGRRFVPSDPRTFKGSGDERSTVLTYCTIFYPLVIYPLAAAIGWSLAFEFISWGIVATALIPAAITALPALVAASLGWRARPRSAVAIFVCHAVFSVLIALLAFGFAVSMSV